MTIAELLKWLLGFLATACFGLSTLYMGDMRSEMRTISHDVGSIKETAAVAVQRLNTLEGNAADHERRIREIEKKNEQYDARIKSLERTRARRL